MCVQHVRCARLRTTRVHILGAFTVRVSVYTCAYSTICACASVQRVYTHVRTARVYTCVRVQGGRVPDTVPDSVGVGVSRGPWEPEVTPEVAPEVTPPGSGSRRFRPAAATHRLLGDLQPKSGVSSRRRHSYSPKQTPIHRKRHQKT